MMRRVKGSKLQISGDEIREISQLTTGPAQKPTGQPCVGQKQIEINYPAASGRGMKTIFSPLSAADFNNAASRGEFEPQRLMERTLEEL